MNYILDISILCIIRKVEFSCDIQFISDAFLIWKSLLLSLIQILNTKSSQVLQLIQECHNGIVSKIDERISKNITS